VHLAIEYADIVNGIQVVSSSLTELESIVNGLLSHTLVSGMLSDGLLNKLTATELRLA
jgi:hypothetical protein